MNLRNLHIHIKEPSRCPKVVKLLDSQFVQDQKIIMTTRTKETTLENVPVTIKNMEMQHPKQSRPPKPTRKYTTTQTGVI